MAPSILSVTSTCSQNLEESAICDPQVRTSTKSIRYPLLSLSLIVDVFEFYALCSLCWVLKFHRYSYHQEGLLEEDEDDSVKKLDACEDSENGSRKLVSPSNFIKNTDE